VHSGDVRVDVQAAISMLAPAWGFKPLLDIDDAEARSNLARASVMVLSYLAQAARGQIAPESAAATSAPVDAITRAVNVDAFIPCSAADTK